MNLCDMSNVQIVVIVGIPFFCFGLFAAAWTIDLFDFEDRLMKFLKFMLFGDESYEKEQSTIEEKEVKEILNNVVNNRIKTAQKVDIEKLISIVNRDLDFSFQLRDAENKNILYYIALIVALGSAFVFCFNCVDKLSAEVFWLKPLAYFLIVAYLFFYGFALRYVYKALSIKFDLPVSSARNIEYYYGPDSAENKKKIECLSHNITVAETCIVGVKKKMRLFRRSKQLMIRASFVLLLFILDILFSKYLGYYIQLCSEM